MRKWFAKLDTKVLKYEQNANRVTIDKELAEPVRILPNSLDNAAIGAKHRPVPPGGKGGRMTNFGILLSKIKQK